MAISKILIESMAHLVLNLVYCHELGVYGNTVGNYGKNFVFCQKCNQENLDQMFELATLSKC